MSGDFMAEDPLCTHTPGRFTDALARTEPGGVRYGVPEERSVEWDDDARQRMRRIPAFVRGMVTRRVESFCRERAIDRVTVEVLEDIRSRMPTPKIFG